MDRVSQAVKDLVEEIQRMPEAPDPAETDRHAFTLLLSGIAACRRALMMAPILAPMVANITTRNTFRSLFPPAAL